MLMQVACRQCGYQRAGPVFCGQCGARILKMRAPSLIGRERQLAAAERWKYLQQKYATDTVAVASSLLNKLCGFMKEDGISDASPFDATPMDVVRFLQFADKGGHTIVHASNCPHWGKPKVNTCACPRRLAYETVRCYRYRLQGAFRDMGLGEAWNPREGAGNPCAAPVVDQYLAMIEAEQCDAGVEVKQAALIDQSVFDAILGRTLECWKLAAQRAAAGDSSARIVAAEYARDALFYSILWDSGLRASDALSLHASQLMFFGPSDEAPNGGLYLLVNTTKTTASLKDVHRITITFDQEGRSLPTIYELWQLYDKCLNDLDFTEADKAGRLFRVLKRDQAGVAELREACSWRTMNDRYEKVLASLGFKSSVAVHITLHSFHGSRAARERRKGIPKENTCASMLWSEEMYDYYTEGREPLTLNGLQAMLKGACGPKPHS